MFALQAAVARRATWTMTQHGTPWHTMVQHGTTTRARLSLLPVLLIVTSAHKLLSALSVKICTDQMGKLCLVYVCACGRWAI